MKALAEMSNCPKITKGSHKVKNRYSLRPLSITVYTKALDNKALKSLDKPHSWTTHRQTVSIVRQSKNHARTL